MTLFEQMNRIKDVLDEQSIKQTWSAEKLDKSHNILNGYVQKRQQPKLEIYLKLLRFWELNHKI